MTHTPTRRRALGALAGAMLAGAAQAQAPETPLPTPPSLQRAAQEAQRRGEPLVLLVSIRGCPFCEHIRRNYLAPMRAQGLAAVQIKLDDSKTQLQDWQGKPSTGAEVAQGLEVKVTPTVLFVDAQGRELAERLVGITSTDFYGAFLDVRLTAARAKLSNKN